MSLERINDYIVIKCEKCSQEITVNYDDISFCFEPFGGSERSMGPETEHRHIEYISCQYCDNQIDIDFRLWEYPVGAVNYYDISIERGELVGELCDFSDRICLCSLDNE